MDTAGSIDQAIGTFHARVTRDATAQARDGEPFYLRNRLDERSPSTQSDLWEIQFGDGVWMLAREPDLTILR